jgi:hypothetical protein
MQRKYFISNCISKYNSSWDMLNNTWTLSEKLRPLITQINFTQNGEVVFKATSFAG